MMTSGKRFGFRRGLLVSRPGTVIFEISLVWLLFGVFSLVTGCATKKSAENQVPPIGNDVAECRQIVAESLLAVKTTLLSVNAIGDQSNAYSSTLLDHLTQDVHRLNVASLKVRARAQAMQARGPAYFEEWHANLHQAKELEIRQRAEQSRVLLQDNFDKIRESAQPTREAFRPFLRSVRKLRNELEQNAANVQADATRELIKSAVENGAKVEKGLGAILEQLSLAEALLKPAQTAAN